MDLFGNCLSSTAWAAGKKQKKPSCSDLHHRMGVAVEALRQVLCDAASMEPLSNSERLLHVDTSPIYSV